MSTFTFVCVAIYILSFIAHILILWREERNNFYKIGDIVDSIEFYMWFPIVNTITLLVLVFLIVMHKLYKLFKIDVVWNWFMNIKLK